MNADLDNTTVTDEPVNEAPAANKTSTETPEVPDDVQDAPDDVQEVQLVPAEIVDADEEGPAPNLAIRHVIERQLVASQELSTELFSAATDVTAALAEAVSKVMTAVDGGATLPAAFSQTGDALQELVNDAASRARSAVGDYVSGRAVLPNAVVAAAAELTASLVRAQGSVSAEAVNSAFEIAAVAVQRGDVRQAWGREVGELSAAARVARERVADSVSAARQGVRDAAAIESAE